MTNPRGHSLVANITKDAPTTVDERLNAVSKRQWVQKVGDIHAFNEMQMSYEEDYKGVYSPKFSKSIIGS